MNLVQLAYTTTLRLATPAILVHLARRTRRQTGTRDDRRARLGFVAADTHRPIWIHAASAGEMQAALPLAAKLAEQYPVRLSAFSASGLARAAAALPDVPASLAPLDLPGAWRRFLTRTNPRLLVLVETELWPNLLAGAAAHRIPVVLASARLTSLAALRLARFPVTTRLMLSRLACVGAQTADDLARFRDLGLPEENGCVTGNLKTALSIPEAVRSQARALRSGPLAGRKVWVAGSVREGEEAFIAELTATLHERVPEAFALIAPRHPERADDFAAALTARGVETIGAQTLDRPDPVAPGTAVVVDRLGVLLMLYAAGDIAFVGGSIAPLGGHNLLEPALLARPIFTGPNLANVSADASNLEAAGALVIEGNAKALAEKMAALLNTPNRAREIGAAAHRSASHARAQALDRTLAALAPFIEGS